MPLKTSVTHTRYPPPSCQKRRGKTASSTALDQLLHTLVNYTSPLTSQKEQRSDDSLVWSVLLQQFHCPLARQRSNRLLHLLRHFVACGSILVFLHDPPSLESESDKEYE